MDERRLLVVDDNPEVRGVVSEALMDQGYAIQIVASAEEAHRAIVQARPSLVLLYVGRPSPDSRAVVRELRERAQDLPILVLGGGSEAQTLAEQIGAVGYVTDPLDLSALVA